jgi:hypothetical protein
MHNDPWYDIARFHMDERQRATERHRLARQVPRPPSRVRRRSAALLLRLAHRLEPPPTRPCSPATAQPRTR